MPHTTVTPSVTGGENAEGALIGQFESLTHSGGRFLARPITDMSGPAKVGPVLEALLVGTFGGNIHRMCNALLTQDWKYLDERAVVEMIAQLDTDLRCVNNIGWAYMRQDPPRQGNMPVRHFGRERWAYVFADSYATLNVYRATRRRWRLISMIDVRDLRGTVPGLWDHVEALGKVLTS